MQSSPKTSRISRSAIAQSCSISYYFTSYHQITTWENNPQCSETLQISAEYTGDETPCYVSLILFTLTQILANVIPFKFLFETRSSLRSIYFINNHTIQLHVHFESLSALSAHQSSELAIEPFANEDLHLVSSTFLPSKLVAFIVLSSSCEIVISKEACSKYWASNSWASSSVFD